MNSGLVAVIGIIGICIGIVIGTKVFHSPIKIEFRVSMLNSFIQAFMMFFIITTAMVLEMYINQRQLQYNPVSWQLRLLSQLIDAGILVALMLPLLSSLFGKWIRAFDMDLCTVYSENVIKIYYSLAVVVNCIWYLMMAGPNIMNDSVENRSILSRVIIWMLNILGTWMGIGFHCKGRIDEEIEYDYKSKEVLTWKEYVKYGIPFGLAFIVNCVLLVVQALNLKVMMILGGYCYAIVLSGLFGMMCALIGCNIIESPSEKRSNRKLVGAVKRANAGKCVNGRYQSIKYNLMNEEGEKYLKIQKRNVIWMGNEAEVNRMFVERKIPMEKFDYILCKDYLGELIKEQRQFIQEGYATCRENAYKRMRDERG